MLQILLTVEIAKIKNTKSFYCDSLNKNFSKMCRKSLKISFYFISKITKKV